MTSNQNPKNLPLVPINPTNIKIKENPTRTFQIPAVLEPVANFIGPENKVQKKKSKPPVPKFMEKISKNEMEIEINQQETLNKFLMEIKGETCEEEIQEKPKENVMEIEVLPERSMEFEEKREGSSEKPNILQVKPENSREKFEISKEKVENSNGKPEVFQGKVQNYQEKPENSKEKPEISNEIPILSKEKPEISKEKPEVSKEKQEISKEKQEISKEKPAISPQKSETKDKPMEIPIKEKEKPDFQKPDFKLNLDLISNMYKQQINLNSKPKPIQKEIIKKTETISNEKVLIPLKKKEIKANEEYDPSKPNDYETLIAERLDKEKKLKDLEKKSKNGMEIEENRGNNENPQQYNQGPSQKINKNKMISPKSKAFFNRIFSVNLLKEKSLKKKRKNPVMKRKYLK